MARPLGAARPHKLKGFWFLVRRVPGEFSAYDTRNPVRISTGIRIVDDPRGVKATGVVTKLDAELLQYWKDKRRGRDRDAEARYELARKGARSLGLDYVPATEAASKLSIEDILRRFEILTRRGTADSAPEVSAVLGGATAPVVMIDAMVDEFEQIVRASLASKSARQKKKWRRPKETALEVFIDRPAQGLRTTRLCANASSRKASCPTRATIPCASSRGCEPDGSRIEFQSRAQDGAALPPFGAPSVGLAGPRPAQVPCGTNPAGREVTPTHTPPALGEGQPGAGAPAFSRKEGLKAAKVAVRAHTNQEGIKPRPCKPSHCPRWKHPPRTRGGRSTTRPSRASRPASGQMASCTILSSDPWREGGKTNVSALSSGWASDGGE